MSSTQTKKVVVAHRTDAEISYETTMDIQHLQFAERLTRALAKLGICWVAAVLFILVPVLHFFLVPAAAIGGVGVFFYQLRLENLRFGSEVKCPKCHAPIKLKKTTFNWPMRETCNNCRTAILLRAIN